jgi:hypothetical protein
MKIRGVWSIGSRLFDEEFVQLRWEVLSRDVEQSAVEHPVGIGLRVPTSGLAASSSVASHCGLGRPLNMSTSTRTGLVDYLMRSRCV